MVEDGTINSSSTSLSIVGRGVVNYGEYIAENEVRLLENFSNTVEPANPIEGQLWYNSSNSIVYVFDGEQWVSPVSENYYSSVTNTTGTATISINNNDGITVGATGKLKLGYNSTTGTLDIVAFTTVSSVNPAISISPTSLLATVAGDPVSPLGIATKNYVDTRTRIGPNSDNFAEVTSNSFILKLSGEDVISGTGDTLHLFGYPTAQTAATETNNTVIATTAFVQSQKESPIFTGVPRAPTASQGTNTTQLATTAFVTNSPAFIGTPTAPTASKLTNTSQIATTAFVQSNKDSPVFTGTPEAPTAAINANTTQIATTAFVQNQLYEYSDSPVFRTNPTAPTASTLTNTDQLATTAFVQANKDSPVFTGVPRAPTAPPATSTTQIASTEFVQAQKVSPVFTGVPRAPTAPAGTRTTQLATTEFVQNVKDELNASLGGRPLLFSLDTRGLDITGEGPGSVVRILNTLAPPDALNPGTVCRIASTVQNVTTTAAVSGGRYIAIRYVTDVTVATTVNNPTRNNNLVYQVNATKTSWEYVSG